MTLHLFIDANVLLSFFHLSSDDLEELRKLSVLIKKGEISVHLSQQVVDEFRRNRGNKIADRLKALRQHKLKMQFSQICKNYPEYASLLAIQKELERAHSALIGKVEADVRDRNLKADAVTTELFAAIKPTPVTDSLLVAARRRHELGNPPGKRDSLGDAVNWETLLEAVPDFHDLYFVTSDKDYASDFDDSRFNEFLKDEWFARKASGLFFFDRLSAFFKEKYPDILLASELEKEDAISRLAASGLFATTHSIISELAAFTDFTDTQLIAMVRSSLSNSQVRWIITDPDLKLFFENLLQRYATRLPSDLSDQLRLALNPIPTTAAPSANDDFEPPF